MLNYLERVQSLARVNLEPKPVDRHPRSAPRALRFEPLDSRLLLDGSGDTIVTFNVTINGQHESFQIELFNSLAPQTVQNFLNYIDSGEYNNTFIHRTTTEAYDGLAVVQGGGYSAAGGPFKGTNQPQHISTDVTKNAFPQGLPNEYSNSLPNVPGTIAMALTGGSSGPNATSGTSEWFINVGDNTSILSSSAAQNGVGYAVFGKVLGTGMDVVNQIQQLKRIEDVLGVSPQNSSQLGIFGPIPVTNFTTETTSVDVPNLVVINSVTHSSASISGTIFADFNSSGTKDAGESGLSGWTAYIDTNNNGVLDSGEATAISDASGIYSFTNLAGGAYTVRVQAQVGGWQSTSSAAQQLTLAESQLVTGKNFGEKLPLAAPGIPVLPAQYITGPAGGSLTHLQSIQLQVSGVVAGSLVQLYDTVNNGSVLLASMTASDTSLSIPLTLSEGEHLIVAVQSQAGFTSAQSGPRSVIVDVTPPQITSGDPAQTSVSANFTYQVTTTDQDTFSLPSRPDGMTIDPNSGLVSWTPTGAQVGFQQFTVAATDLAGNTTQKTFTVAVSGPPRFTPISDQIVNQGSTLKIVPSVSTINTPLTYSLAPGAPAGATFNPQTGEFDWTPTAGDAAGQYQITINVQDSVGNTATSGVINILVNAPPVFTPLTDQTIDEQHSFSLPLMVSDQKSVTFSFVTTPPDGASIAGTGTTAGTGIFLTTGGLFTWTPSEVQGAGVYTIAIKATDENGLSTIEQFQITVNEVDLAPTIDPVGAVSVKQGNSVSVSVVAHDEDLPAQQLVYSLGSNAPAGAAINPQTGLLSWTVPTGYPTGQVVINVVVTEVGGQGLSVTQPVAVNVDSGFTGFDLFTTGAVNLGGFASGLAINNGVVINGTLSLSPFGSTQPGGLPAPIAALQQLAGQVPVHAGIADVGARLPAGIVDVVLGFDSGIPHNVDGMELELARYGSSGGGQGYQDQDEGEVQKAGNFETFEEGQNQRDPRNDSGQFKKLNVAPLDHSSSHDFWGPAAVRRQFGRAMGQAGYVYRAPRGVAPLPALPTRSASRLSASAEHADGGRISKTASAAAAALSMPLLVTHLPENQQRSRKKLSIGRLLDPRVN